MSKLRACSVKFKTTDEDKDDDTRVTVEVRDRNNVVVARVSDTFGLWEDFSENADWTRAVAAIDAFTQAAAHGVDATSMAVNLRQIAAELAVAEHPAEAQQADQAAHNITG